MEYAAFCLKKGQADSIIKDLDDLSTRFSHQSEITEALRTNLLLAISYLQNRKWVQAQVTLQNVRDSRLIEPARNILVQSGVEFKNVFEDAIRNLVGYEPIAYILKLVNEYQLKIPIIDFNNKLEI